ncbi:DUF5320 domain-containing protein [Candidatus Woesearchaeota archaeon]|nr:DUF5320 domain-containing protein [Candidatus Woesearchaeota archaeon]
MPGYDGTGPRGEGSRTGRGMGYCRPTGGAGYAPRGAGRGSAPYGGGRGRAFGGGRGAGFGRGMGFGRGLGFGPNAPWPYDGRQEQDLGQGSNLEKITEAVAKIMESANEVLAHTKDIINDYRKAKEEPKQ